MCADSFELVPKPVKKGRDPYLLQDGSRISLERDDFSTLLLERLTSASRGSAKRSDWLIVTGSGHFTGTKRAGLNDLRHVPTLATVLQQWHNNFGIGFSLDDITDRDALESPELLSRNNLILMGGVFVNFLTAYLTKLWPKSMRPGFESGASGTLRGARRGDVFRTERHDPYGLFSLAANPWNASPSICVILGGISGIGTQASTRYFIDILRRSVESSNNAARPDSPGHILKARVRKYIRTRSNGRAGIDVVSLEEPKGWELVE